MWGGGEERRECEDGREKVVGYERACGVYEYKAEREREERDRSVRADENRAAAAFSYEMGHRSHCHTHWTSVKSSRGASQQDETQKQKPKLPSPRSPDARSIYFVRGDGTHSPGPPVPASQATPQAEH